MIPSDWQSQIFQKKEFEFGQSLGPKGPSQTQNEVFRHFIEFES